jgi:hypothetical protein
MVEIRTISEYIKGVSQLITEDGLGYVLAKRGLKGTELLPQYESKEGDTTLTQRDVDLAEGTAYYWLSNLPVGGSTEKVSDGGWSHSEGGWTVSKANIEEWLRKYRAIFAMWDEPLIIKSRIKIINF